MSLDIMTGKTSVKATLRRQMRARIREMSPGERASESQSIREQLTFPHGAKVALFAGTQSEPQLLQLLSKNSPHTWFLPRVLDENTMDFLPVSDLNSLEKGAFGIREPTAGIPAPELDFIVCPGLAFTSHGQRLGQGGGFYDRALPRFPNARLIGVAFSCQLLDHESLPIEEHDFAMHKVITPRSES